MKNLIYIAILTFSLPIFAQQKHELSLGGGIGYSALTFQNGKGGLGGNFGLGYTYHFNDNFGLRSGAGLALYNAKVTGDHSITRALEREFHETPEGYDFLYTVTAKGVDEKEKASFLQIPLMLQYRSNPDQGFYAAAGVKVGIPMSSTYSTKVKEITTSGFSEYTQQTYTDLPLAGFSTYDEDELSGSGDLGLKLGVWGSIEGGMMWNISNKGWKLYTGLFLDYAFNNLANSNHGNFVDYNKSETPVVHATGLQSDKIGALAAGITLRFSIGLGGRKSSKETVYNEQPTQSAGLYNNKEIVQVNENVSQAPQPAVIKRPVIYVPTQKPTENTKIFLNKARVLAEAEAARIASR